MTWPHPIAIESHLDESLPNAVKARLRIDNSIAPPGSQFPVGSSLKVSVSAWVFDLVETRRRGVLPESPIARGPETHTSATTAYSTVEVPLPRLRAGRYAVVAKVISIDSDYPRPFEPSHCYASEFAFGSPVMIMDRALVEAAYADDQVTDDREAIREQVKAGIVVVQKDDGTFLSAQELNQSVGFVPLPDPPMGSMSPLSCLEQSIFDSVVNVAPEKHERFRSVENARGITFLVDRDSPKIVIKAKPASAEIILGIRGLERFWAHSYAYWCIYQEMVAQQSSAPNEPFMNLGAKGRTRSARNMLIWALRNQFLVAGYHADFRTGAITPAPADSVVETWPAGSPEPAHAAHANDERVANELFLCGTGYLLLHEVAHVELGHAPCAGPESMQQETEADNYAGDWILGDLDQADPRFVKRSLGVTLACLWNASMAIHGLGKSSTHPPAATRLFHALSRHISDSDHPAWFFAATGLYLHLQNRGAGALAPVEYPTARSCVDALVDLALT